MGYENDEERKVHKVMAGHMGKLHDEIRRVLSMVLRNQRTAIQPETHAALPIVCTRAPPAAA